MCSMTKWYYMMFASLTSALFFKVRVELLYFVPSCIQMLLSTVSQSPLNKTADPDQTLPPPKSSPCTSLSLKVPSLLHTTTATNSPSPPPRPHYPHHCPPHPRNHPPNTVHTALSGRARLGQRANNARDPGSVVHQPGVAVPCHALWVAGAEIQPA